MLYVPLKTHKSTDTLSKNREFQYLQISFSELIMIAIETTLIILFGFLLINFTFWL